MLTNAAIGGVAVSSYIAVLALQLNPHYSLAGLPVLLLTMTGAYGVNAAVAFYALIVLQQLLATEPISPGWISYRVLVWFCSAAAATGAFLMWINWLGFGPVLDSASGLRMAAGAVALSVAAAAMLLLATWHTWQGRQHSRIEAGLLAFLVMASLAVPMTFRGPGTPAAPPSPRRSPIPASLAVTDQGQGRVRLLLFEGVSLDVLAPEAADGRLPSFGRLFETGAFLHLATLRPTQPSTVWSAAATGKLPSKNGIRSAATYWPVGGWDALEVLPDFCFSHTLVRFGFLRQVTHTSRDVTARPIWDILSQYGVPVGVVDWSLTQPAPDLLGYAVSDEFERLTASAAEVENNQSVWPREAVSIAAAAAAQPPMGPRVVQAARNRQVSDLIAQTCRADAAYEQMVSALERQYPSRFQAVRFKCLDAAGHYLLRYAAPNPFGDVSDEEVERYRVALGGYYAAADATVGRAMAAMRPGDLLIVLSGFGMDPLDVGKRLLERALGNPVPSGTHDRAPDGFMLAVGSGVKPGRYARASIVDVAPTVLYYFGLPVGRDMDGFARTDIFQRSVTDRKLITFIPTYEHGPAPAR